MWFLLSPSESAAIREPITTSKRILGKMKQVAMTNCHSETASIDCTIDVRVIVPSKNGNSLQTEN